MKLGFIGGGYVGLVSAAGYASLGHNCQVIDIDKKKVDAINNAVAPIYEEGLDELLKKITVSKHLVASTNYSDLANCELIFICVGTPSGKDGSINLSYIKSCAEQLGKMIKLQDNFPIIAVKSTVVPKTTQSVVLPLLENHSGKKAGVDFGIAMVPEFLKEGSALSDFNSPDRIVIGVNDKKSSDALKKLHSHFKCEILEVPLATAELIKYASNSFLATKISFINQIANLCDVLGLDVDDVAKGMGLDSRIGKQFLKAGPGFGGSCFPKDVKALMHFSSQNGIAPTILESVMGVNYLQPQRMLKLALEATGGGPANLIGKTVSVLGLAFKPDTDDCRESPAIPLVEELLKMNCKIQAYDPKGIDNFKKLFPNLQYAKDMESALAKSHACFIVTDWKEFKKPISYYESKMAFPLIIDSRRILDAKTKAKAIYRAIGKGGTS
ncbi:UDP-glucose/GDP-mannose dehydrogenase family protein [Candidatus Micrarchaeota archaeon]|nr:UDP-glucose/GDP-mannose dehydrogenase family protein [Candidatus Micrarchaeota archaeon]